MKMIYDGYEKWVGGFFKDKGMWNSIYIYVRSKHKRVLTATAPPYT